MINNQTSGGIMRDKPITITTIASCALLFLASTVLGAEPVTPIECNLQRPVPQEDFIGAVNLANGLESHGYDTNHDGQSDVELLLPQDDENRYPLLYMFDNNYDYYVDIAWVDKLRDGTCGQVEVYWYASQKDKL